MRKSLSLVALVISSSFVGAVAADGVSTTRIQARAQAPTQAPAQAFLSELAQQPKTPLFETLPGTSPKAAAVDHCFQTICYSSRDCAPPTCDFGGYCGFDFGSYGYCDYL
jgi:hypothetical protein